eukprot:gb/GECG01009674.1/.p1 GENE.gb/GECG01009674.1/~~gb/GECG01009674.1/.p1  ORF type:complete len:1580 (+),score=253.46 gb/GECG01009674.1/:1-4740(+)
MNYDVSSSERAGQATTAAAVDTSGASATESTPSRFVTGGESSDEFLQATSSSKQDDQSAPITPPESANSVSGGGGGGGGAAAGAPPSSRNHLHTREQWARRKHRTVGVARPIRVGVAARDKKAHSKPMEEILGRLSAYGHFDIIIFGDDCILNQPPEEWPIVDCLISFFSTGFPLEKAEAYVRLRRPFCVNDIHAERVLRDRRKFYEVLKQHNIPTPRQLLLNMDDDPPPQIREDEDSLEINGEKLSKPFVEKPVDAEDHNVYIYYPRRLGGGCKRLFRKVQNKSSEFYRDINTIRGGKDGRSYIYEEFVMTQGTDIKIYIVGPDYAHAEARKSPVVDGIVWRDSEGKEVRFPIMLTHEEKELARKVCLAFRQNVCGFDLLRTHERSFVCDVNGWSFVKKSHKYYDDTAQLLCLMMLRAVAPTRLRTRPKGPRRPLGRVSNRKSKNQEDDGSASPSSSSDKASRGKSKQNNGRRPEELRCVAAVIRHGDRTPKQKLKMTVSHPLFLKLFRVFAKKPREEIKLKRAQELQLVLDVTRKLVDVASHRDSDSEAEIESMEKLQQVKAVLEKGGQFSGINRKVQIKPTKWAAFEGNDTVGSPNEMGSVDTQGCSPSLNVDTSLPEQETVGMQSPVEPSRDPNETRIPPSADCLQRQSFHHNEWEEDVTEATLILKWGGVLTEKGREQAEALGRMFRGSMYPGDSLGLLRLHSTYRHDLKIYSSDEGRVQMTAAAFAKGFLDLEGELTPILASLVRFDNTGQMLDHCESATKAMADIKSKLREAITMNGGYSASPGRMPKASEHTAKKPDSANSQGSMPHSSPNATQSTMAVHATSKTTPSGGHNGRPPTAVRLRLPHLEIDSQEKLLRLISPDLVESVAPTRDVSLLRALRYIGNDPEIRLHELYTHIDNLVSQISKKLENEQHSPLSGKSRGRSKALLSTATMEEGDTRGGVALRSQSQLYANETLWLMHDRWMKLKKGLFHPKKKRWDLSKIPDIYDCVKYDTLHNQHIGLEGMQEIYFLTRAFADIIIPQEYGITASDKRDISADICHHLLRKLFFDMTAVSASNVNVTFKKQGYESGEIYDTVAEEVDYPEDDGDDTVGFDDSRSAVSDTSTAVQQEDKTKGKATGVSWEDRGDVTAVAVPSNESKEQSPPDSPKSQGSAISDGVSQANQDSSFSADPMLPTLPRRALVRRNSSPALGIALSAFDVQRGRSSGAVEDKQSGSKHRETGKAVYGREENTVYESMRRTKNKAPVKEAAYERIRSVSASSDQELPAEPSNKFTGTLNALGSGDSVLAVPHNRQREGPASVASGEGSNHTQEDNSGKHDIQRSKSEKSKDATSEHWTSREVSSTNIEEDNTTPAYSVADMREEDDQEAADSEEVETWDMADLRENVHQLDSRVAEDGGYAVVRTPSRHVRTRLYFTSESHVTSLINVLRYWTEVICADNEVENPLISSDALEMLSATPELDYLSHIVFRLYENLNYPVDHPKRHRLEILLSPGAAFNPFDSRPRTPRSCESITENKYWAPSLCAIPLGLHVRLPVFEDVLTAAIRRYGSDPLAQSKEDNGDEYDKQRAVKEQY